MCRERRHSSPASGRSRSSRPGRTAVAGGEPAVQLRSCLYKNGRVFQAENKLNAYAILCYPCNTAGPCTDRSLKIIVNYGWLIVVRGWLRIHVMHFSKHGIFGVNVLSRSGLRVPFSIPRGMTRSREVTRKLRSNGVRNFATSQLRLLPVGLS